MVELFGLTEKLRLVNEDWQPADALYLYGDPAYCIVYNIMGLYKKYPGRPQTLAQEKFNKTMAKLQIKVEYSFAIHQNLRTWNGFYLGLKIGQRVAVKYAVLMFLSNIWICIKGNQTSYWFTYIPLAVEEYLQLLAINDTDSEIKNIETSDANEHIKRSEVSNVDEYAEVSETNNVDKYIKKLAKRKLEAEDDNDEQRIIIQFSKSAEKNA